ncbi:MAG: LPXTG cell wall anchor domain-containing protein, partial [Ruminiclostridium sp.]
DEAPADEAPADEAPADEAPADEAPADEAPVVDNTAAGDVDAATDSSKGSPDTGIESVAVIGGLALLAGAGIALTRKRK